MQKTAVSCTQPFITRLNPLPHCVLKLSFFIQFQYTKTPHRCQAKKLLLRFVNRNFKAIIIVNYRAVNGAVLYFLPVPGFNRRQGGKVLAIVFLIVRKQNAYIRLFGRTHQGFQADYIVYFLCFRIAKSYSRTNCATLSTCTVRGNKSAAQSFFGG